MKTQLTALSLILVMLAAGCSVFVPQESRYLQLAQGRAVQDEVRQQLGPPRVTSTSPTGEAIWVYEVYTIEPGSQNSWASTGSWCDEYVLTFDREGVLQRWTHTSYLHGGETMPASCNSTLGVQKQAL
jgi:hypothetical protein